MIERAGHFPMLERPARGEPDIRVFARQVLRRRRPARRPTATRSRRKAPSRDGAAREGPTRSARRRSARDHRCRGYPRRPLDRPVGLTGCTVVLCPAGHGRPRRTCAAERPGTRETDALRPGTLVPRSTRSCSRAGAPSGSPPPTAWFGGSRSTGSGSTTGVARVPIVAGAGPVRSGDRRSRCSARRRCGIRGVRGGVGAARSPRGPSARAPARPSRSCPTPRRVKGGLGTASTTRDARGRRGRRP